MDLLDRRQRIAQSWTRIKYSAQIYSICSLQVGSLFPIRMVVYHDTCWDWFQRIYVLITAQNNL